MSAKLSGSRYVSVVLSCSAVATAGAARGLAAEDRQRASGNFANYNSLDDMEELEISDTEVIDFLKEGLGK